jgi:hypothetical protein
VPRNPHEKNNEEKKVVRFPTCAQKEATEPADYCRVTVRCERLVERCLRREVVVGG